MQLAKHLDLLGVERMVGNLGAGEVAQQQRDAVIFGLRARGEGCRLVRRNAEPMHAGVDLQRGAALPAMGADEGVPLRKLGRRIDDRPRIDFDKSGAPIRRKAVKHVDGGLACTRTHRSRFGEIGDEECFAAGLGQGRGHLRQAEAIAIGLDHRGAFDGKEPVRQRAPICFDCGEIDGERAAGLRRRRSGDRGGNPVCAWQGRIHGRVMTGAAAAVKRGRHERA